MNDHHDQKSGYAALIGRPNVGKSTLLNALLGKKVSITSHKAQTTRTRILGVASSQDAQVIYVDTPGIHTKTPHLLNRQLNRAARGAIFDVDVILLMVEAGRWLPDDDLALQQVLQAKAPVILVVNKTDAIKEEGLVRFLTDMPQKGTFAAIIPISAKSGNNLERLEHLVLTYMPKTDFFYFPTDQITGSDQAFQAAELLREKLFRRLGEELPYYTAVQIERFEKKPKIWHIHAVIWVARESQKGMVIGKDGVRLKQIGREARLDMERHFEQKIYLALWVKVKTGWSDDQSHLKRLGLSDQNL